MTLDHVSLAFFVVAFFVGLRATYHLWKVDQPQNGRRSRLTRAFFVVSAVVTAAAGYFGALSSRRVLGFDPLPFTPPLSLLVAAAVLFIPPYLDWVVGRIRRGK